MALPDTLRLDGQTALVTGASSGIGQAAAIALAEAGANVAINYRSSIDGARETLSRVTALGVRGTLNQGDVASQDDVIAMFDAAQAQLGPLDIVFSNAGRQKDGPIADMSLDDWNAVISVNLTGAFLTAREAIRRFRAKGLRPEVSRAAGKLIFNSSVHQRIPWAFRANYAASKGGLKLLMESLTQEVAQDRIRINAVAPGAIATAINEAERDSDGGEAEMLKLIPYGRIGTPEDVGRAVAWLASDASDYVVGTTLFVDGGMSLYPEFRGNG